MFLVLPHQLLQVMHSKHAQAASPPYGRATLAGRTIRDITHPGLVRHAHVEVAFQQIRCDWQIVLRIRRVSELALLLATQSQLGANAPNAVKANAYAMIKQIRLQSLAPIRLPSSFVRRYNLDFKARVLLCTWRVEPSAPSVETAGP